MGRASTAAGESRRRGTTGEVPLERFAREARCLRPGGAGRRSASCGDLTGTVHAECVVVVDTDAYSVRWRLVGERVRVVVSGGRVRVHPGPRIVAEHVEHEGATRGDTDRAHLAASPAARARPRPRRPSLHPGAASA